MDSNEKKQDKYIEDLWQASTTEINREMESHGLRIMTFNTFSSVMELAISKAKLEGELTSMREYNQNILEMLK